MPIKLEILADNALELVAHLEGLLAKHQPGPAFAEQIKEEAVQVQAPPPSKPKRTRIKPKAPAVKPLPLEEEDPLETSEADFVDDVEEEADEPAATSPDTLIGEATDKLRDLFKLNAKGVNGVRKLREKYQVTYFHEVPKDRAAELWADAVKLEKELAP